MPVQRRIAVCLLLAGVFLPGAAFSHEMQPGAFEMRQLTDERFEILWRAPIYYNRPHPARLQFPSDWEILRQPSARHLGDSILHRHLVRVPATTLDQAVIRFDGLEATITDVFARFVWLDGSVTRTIARPGQPQIRVSAQRSSWQVAQDYTLLGIDHILSGFDHLGFVLALLLIVRGTRRLLITVTAFTLAHSITLAAATLDLVHLPGPPVEATIALSILFLAVELVRLDRGCAGLTARYPWIVAFIFGLLHGFGFAGALTEVGLPQNEIPLALLMFNVGVELGQLMFIALVLVLITLARQSGRSWPRWCDRIPAYGIGSMASFWLIERLSRF